MGKKVDKKVKLKKTKLIVVTLILLLAIFFIVVTQTDIFNVKKISVSGNSEVPKDKIALASGIVMGENIFKLNIKSAKENLLLHPYIKNANIKRDYPDKINIKIDERQEIAFIKHMNTYVYIGFDGLVLDVLDEQKENKVPLLTGIDIENPSIGSRIIYKKKKEKESKQIKDLVESLSKEGIKSQTKEIVFKGKNIDLKLESGTKIAFGGPFNIEYKMKFLDKTLKDLKQKNINAKNIYLNKGDDIIVEVVGSQEEKNED